MPERITIVTTSLHSSIRPGEHSAVIRRFLLDSLSAEFGINVEGSYVSNFDQTAHKAQATKKKKKVSVAAWLDI